MSGEGAQLARDALADVQLVAQLRSAYADAQAIMGRTLADFGLTEQRYHLLLTVAAGDGEGRVQGSLARELHCPESRVSLLVRELVETGMVEAVRDDPDDRRLVRVRLTAAGDLCLRSVISVQRDALHELISTLDGTEVTRLAELVARTYLGLDLSVSLRTPQQPPRQRGRRAAAPSEPATKLLPITRAG